MRKFCYRLDFNEADNKLPRRITIRHWRDERHRMQVPNFACEQKRYQLLMCPKKHTEISSLIIQNTCQEYIECCFMSNTSLPMLACVGTGKVPICCVYVKIGKRVLEKTIMETQRITLSIT